MESKTTSPYQSGDGAARSLLEVALGFLGVLFVLPFLFKVLGRVFSGLFRIGYVRKLFGEVIFVGFTALLTHDAVLDRVFGKKGKTGDGLLKPHVED